MPKLLSVGLVMTILFMFSGTAFGLAYAKSVLWAHTAKSTELVMMLIVGSGLVGLAGFGRKKYLKKQAEIH
jgi:hypothetical protein